MTGSCWRTVPPAEWTRASRSTATAGSRRMMTSTVAGAAAVSVARATGTADAAERREQAATSVATMIRRLPQEMPRGTPALVLLARLHLPGPPLAPWPLDHAAHTLRGAPRLVQSSERAICEVVTGLVTPPWGRPPSAPVGWEARGPRRPPLRE